MYVVCTEHNRSQLLEGTTKFSTAVDYAVCSLLVCSLLESASSKYLNKVPYRYMFSKFSVASPDIVSILP